MNLKLLNKKSIWLIIIFAITFTIAIRINEVKASASNIYYVSTNGNDSNQGTISSPFRTIKKGMMNLRQGDTLFIRGGTYSNERIDVVNMKGSTEKWYTVKNYPGEIATLDGKGVADVAMKFIGSSYWHIEGLEITNYRGAGIWLNGQSAANSNFQLIGLKIHNFNDPVISAYGTEGILGDGDSNFCTVKNCEIYDVGLLNNLKKDHGIYIGYGVKNWIIDANRIHDNSGAGIHMYGEPDGGSYCTVTNNLVYNNHNYGIVLASKATETNVYNNTLYNNSECDVYMRDGASGNTFKNNIFGSFGSNFNIEIMTSDVVNNSFDYNCYWKTDGQVIYRYTSGLNLNQWKSYGVESHSQYGDPKFINASGGNFRVYGNSRTTGMGIDDGKVPYYDYEGNLREAPTHEIGAYDYNILYDEFDNKTSKNSSNPVKYTIFGGGWRTMVDGSYVMEQYGEANKVMKAISGKATWDNYSVEAKVKMLTSGYGSDAGLIARCSDDGEVYYLVRLETSGVTIYKVEHGNWTNLGYTTGNYSKDNWYNMGIICNGAMISASINGRIVKNVIDYSITKGKAGMYTSYYARWDNFKVSPRN